MLAAESPSRTGFSPFRTRQLLRITWQFFRNHTQATVLGVGMFASGANLIWHSLGVWFWADDWDLLFLRGTIPKYDVGLFAPHNNHWLTSQVLAYRLIFTAFGMGSYTPYAIVEVSLHLAIVATIYVLLQRAGAASWASVFTALAVAFFGLGANAEIYAASMNHVGALLFGFLAVTCVLSENVSPQQMQTRSAILLLISLTFGLTALSTLVLVAMMLLVRHGWRLAVRVLSLPVVCFLLWWFFYGRHSSSISDSITTGSIPNVDLAKIPSYIWTGLTGTLGDGSGLTGAGPVLVMILVLGLILVRNQPPALLQLAWAGLIADTFQLLIVSIARFDFGPEQLGQSHYAYINIVLLAPAIGLLANAVPRRLRVARLRASAVLFVVSIAYLANGVTYVQKWQHDFITVSAGGRELALGIASGLSNGQRVLTNKNRDPYNRLLVPKYVGTPEILRALPQQKSTPEGRINADSQFFTGVGTKDYGLAHDAGASVVQTYSGFASKPFKPGCQRRTPTVADPILLIKSGDLGNEIVVWSNSTEIKTRLQRAELSGPLTTWEAHPGAMHIATSARSTDLYVSFNGTGSYLICLG